MSIRYFKLDYSGNLLKDDDGECSYLGDNGEWVIYPPVFSKLYGGDTDYEEISEAEAEATVVARKEESQHAEAREADDRVVEANNTKANEAEENEAERMD